MDSAVRGNCRKKKAKTVQLLLDWEASVDETAQACNTVAWLFGKQQRWGHDPMIDLLLEKEANGKTAKAYAGQPLYRKQGCMAMNKVIKPTKP